MNETPDACPVGTRRRVGPVGIRAVVENILAMYHCVKYGLYAMVIWLFLMHWGVPLFFGGILKGKMIPGELWMWVRELSIVFWGSSFPILFCFGLLLGAVVFHLQVSIFRRPYSLCLPAQGRTCGASIWLLGLALCLPAGIEFLYRTNMPFWTCLTSWIVGDILALAAYSVGVWAGMKIFSQPRGKEAVFSYGLISILAVLLFGLLIENSALQEYLRYAVLTFPLPAACVGVFCVYGLVRVTPRLDSYRSRCAEGTVSVFDRSRSKPDSSGIVAEEGDVRPKFIEQGFYRLTGGSPCARLLRDIIAPVFEWQGMMSLKTVLGGSGLLLLCLAFAGYMIDLLKDGEDSLPFVDSYVLFILLLLLSASRSKINETRTACLYPSSRSERTWVNLAAMVIVSCASIVIMLLVSDLAGVLTPLMPDIRWNGILYVYSPFTFEHPLRILGAVPLVILPPKNYRLLSMRRGVFYGLAGLSITLLIIFLHSISLPIRALLFLASWSTAIFSIVRRNLRGDLVGP